MWEKISEKKICRKFTRMLVRILFLRFPPNDNTRIFHVTPDYPSLLSELYRPIVNRSVVYVNSRATS